MLYFLPDVHSVFMWCHIIACRTLLWCGVLLYKMLLSVVLSVMICALEDTWSSVKLKKHEYVANNTVMQNKLPRIHTHERGEKIDVKEATLLN